MNFTITFKWLRRHWKEIVGIIVGAAGYAYAACNAEAEGRKDGASAMARVSSNAAKKLSENPNYFDDEKVTEEFVQQQWKEYFMDEYGWK